MHRSPSDLETLKSVFEVLYPGEKLGSETAGHLAVRLRDLAAEACSLAETAHTELRQTKKRKSGIALQHCTVIALCSKCCVPSLCVLLACTPAQWAAGCT